MPRLSLVLLALAGVAVPPAHASLRDGVDSLPAEIRTVQTCGSWRSGADAGTHRVVIADEGALAGSALYVQWVREAMGDRPAEVLHTRPIQGLAGGRGELSIQSVRCVTQGKGSSLEIHGLIEHEATPRVHAWLLTLLPGGGYEVKESTR